MKNLKQLEKRMEKELELARQHEQNAEALKREIDYLRGSVLQENCKKLQMSAEEFTALLSLMKDKLSLMEAVEVMKDQNRKDRKEKEDTSETEIHTDGNDFDEDEKEEHPETDMRYR